MKNPLIVLSLSLVTLSSSAAPPTDESIRSLFAVMKVESIVNGIYAAIEPAIRQGIAQATDGNEPTQEQKRIIVRFSQRMVELLRTELSWKNVEPIQIGIYRDSFEQTEVDGLIEFYSSAVGQSFTSKMPMVTQKAMAQMQVYMQQVVPKMQAVMQEMIADVKSAK